jgi:hypothetical protein
MADDRRTLAERLSGAQLDSLDAKIRNCDSARQIQELMLLVHQPSGVVHRDSDGGLSYQIGGEHLPSATPPVETPQPKPIKHDGMLRSLWKLPNGTLQVLEAYSQTGLDILEASLLQWGATRAR